MSRRARRQPSPRDAAEALGYDTGSRAIPVVIEEIAIGTRSSHPRAKRADPLNRVLDCTDAMKKAAAIYAQAYERVDAGKGMGPLPGAPDRAMVSRGDDGGVVLLPQEAALSAAEWYRRGEQAMGLAASQGVVQWVVIAGGSLSDYDAVRRWREGTGKDQLLAALERLAGAYGCG